MANGPVRVASIGMGWWSDVLADAIQRSGKIEIAFPAGVRVLACAKAVSTLERPAVVSNVPISDRPPKSQA